MVDAIPAACRGIAKNDRLGKHRWLVGRMHAWGMPGSASCVLASNAASTSMSLTLR
ncbi:protein of unknown function (plasmid) [Cupriavidus taiwanensis]|nr:protein of unknown function [Cupriavidus taiwanensis]